MVAHACFTVAPPRHPRHSLHFPSIFHPLQIWSSSVCPTNFLKIPSPLCTRNLTTRRSPSAAATWSGVFPPLSALPMSAPLPDKTWRISKWPHSAALEFFKKKVKKIDSFLNDKIVFDNWKTLAIPTADWNILTTQAVSVFCSFQLFTWTLRL